MISEALIVAGLAVTVAAPTALAVALLLLIAAMDDGASR